MIAEAEESGILYTPCVDGAYRGRGGCAVRTIPFPSSWRKTAEVMLALASQLAHFGVAQTTS